MRWFVEVSRVSEGDSVERYCVEAKQWQAALQESRRLRGDSGPLSKFSIELLDDGYRAVDPALKIRFVVKSAPADAPLTDEAEVARAGNGRSAPSPSSSPGSPLAIGSDRGRFESARPIGAASSPAVHKEPAAKPGSVAPPRPAPKQSPSSRPLNAGSLAATETVPKAPKLPDGLFPGVSAPEAAPAVSAVSTPLRPVSLEVLETRVLRQRAEEPRSESPITYREIAYSVKPGASRNAVEAVLWARFREISESLADRQKGRFIQLAVFDHVFEKKPLRPPLATLAWKDWRGSPVLSFPGFEKLSRSPSTPPGPKSVPPEADAEVPILLENRKQAGSPPAVGASVPEELPPAPPEPAEPPAPRPAEAAPAFERAQAPIEASGRSGAAALGERRPGEDLISELFETTHELAFMPDVRSGAEFVLGLLKKILPSEAVLIHVFDINTQNFVVVRAYGPSPQQALLSRTPDKDPLCNEVMRRGTSLVVENAAADERFAAARWEALGHKPRRAVCGPVRQGGRYLGLIEIGDPLGEAPVHETEINALDYVCEQFAEFLVNRPIVLEADVILGKG
jgi:hypothetical protein